MFRNEDGSKNSTDNDVRRPGEGGVEEEEEEDVDPKSSICCLQGCLAAGAVGFSFLVGLPSGILLVIYGSNNHDVPLVSVGAVLVVLPLVMLIIVTALCLNQRRLTRLRKNKVTISRLKKSKAKIATVATVGAEVATMTATSANTETTNPHCTDTANINNESSSQSQHQRF